MAFRILSPLFCVLATLYIRVLAAESAWNGHTTPGSDTPSPFLPYYVPSGAKGYDSTSPFLHYFGQWTESYSNSYVGHSVQETDDDTASLSFTALCTGIEWFGNCRRCHAIADVYVDGQFHQAVDTWCDSDETRKQQRLFWTFDLPPQKHNIKIFKRPGPSQHCPISIDALVVTLANHLAPGPVLPRSVNPDEQWTLEQIGTTGVNAMQLTVISPSHAAIFDKVEHNPLDINGHPAWGALYNLNSHAVKPLSMKSNSFCAGGSFLSNGTLVSVGGNPVVEERTSAADFGDADGLQSIRIIEPCLSESVGGCDIVENASRLRMASPRWYNTVVRLPDGSAMIVGGSKKGGWINNATVNNPTIEYFPPKSIHGSNGMPILLPFLKDTLNSNLFPIVFSLPDGKIFMAANNDAMIYDWVANTERRLPPIPNGVRVTYPMAGSAVLLPLSPANNYQPQVLICGGSALSDTIPGYRISSQDPASAQCSRITLTEEGIAAGWEVDQMPEPRIMPDMVLLPTGEVVVVNGGMSGISGYGNVIDQVGESNADHPALTPVLYSPDAPLGQRFSSHGMPTSQIPRLYHSVASMTPNGSVMIAGGNPNLDRSETMYGTEYRVEWLSPPYMTKARPQILGGPEQIPFGETAEFTIRLPPGPMDLSSDVQVVLMDFGFVTHAVHANSRLVYLEATPSDAGTRLTITGPPSGKIYPPGPGWLFVVVAGVPSEAHHVLIGDGRGPEVDEAALNNVLENTKPDQYEESEKSKSDEDE